MKPDILLDHTGPSEFSSQMINVKSRLFLLNEYFIHVFLCPHFTFHFTDMFKMHSQCIIFLPSLSLSQFWLSAKSGKNALSFYNLPQQVCIHSHVTCQVSMKPIHNPKSVCVFGGGQGQSWVKLWLHTACHAVGSDQSPIVTVTWSIKCRPNVEGFLEGMGFCQHKQQYAGQNGSFQSAFFILFLAMKIKNKDWSFQSIRKEACLVSQLPIF